MDLMTRHHLSQKLGASNSIGSLPDIRFVPSTNSTYRSDYGKLQREKTFSGFTERNLYPVQSRYSSTISPWRPGTYFSANRVHTSHLEGPLVNSTFETGKLHELEGLRVPAIYSAARNALYCRYTPADWMRTHDERLARSDEARRRAERARLVFENSLESVVPMFVSGMLEPIPKIRDRSSSCLPSCERISDIYFMKTQLVEETDALVNEMNRLMSSKRVLEKAYQETENPLHITQECLYHREKRQSTDLVHDHPERSLLTEIDVIKSCQRDFSRLLEKASAQLG
ncbi:unnamed protein product [Echinostoma caproni]|uniref:Tektin n=1 Tax=Echinostoma caproni TaxID=27848 RepID=A0A183AS40_9TREM|nr:unnamed protein product [Echinostoma caproni]